MKSVPQSSLCFVRRLVAAAFTLCSGVFSHTARGQDFQDSNLAYDGFSVPDGVADIDFLPNGDLLAAEKQGRVRLFRKNGTDSTGFNNYNTSTVILDIRSETVTNSESGLLSLIVDPAFTVNRHVYIFVTSQTEQRVVRYTLSADASTLTTPTAIVAGLPRETFIHRGGGLAFDPGNSNHLFVGVGDGGYVEGNQDEDSYVGKILRVDKTTGEGVSVTPPSARPNLAPYRLRCLHAACVTRFA